MFILSHLILLIFYKPVYKSKGKESSRDFNAEEKKENQAWDLGIRDAYADKESKTSDDLKIEAIDEVVYKEGYMYAKESIELRQNLVRFDFKSSQGSNS